LSGDFHSGAIRTGLRVDTEQKKSHIYLYISSIANKKKKKKKKKKTKSVPFRSEQVGEFVASTLQRQNRHKQHQTTSLSSLVRLFNQSLDVQERLEPVRCAARQARRERRANTARFATHARSVVRWFGLFGFVDPRSWPERSMAA
jgi:hypothetical protein